MRVAGMLILVLDSWMKWVTKEKVKKANSHHIIKMMLIRDLHKHVTNLTARNVAWDIRRFDI